MHRDLFGHHHLGEDQGRNAGAVLRRGGTAAASARKKRMFRDDDGLIGQGHRLVGGQEIQPRHRLLAVKELHAFQLHRLPPGQEGPQRVNGVGPDGAV